MYLINLTMPNIITTKAVIYPNAKAIITPYAILLAPSPMSTT